MLPIRYMFDDCDGSKASIRAAAAATGGPNASWANLDKVTRLG